MDITPARLSPGAAEPAAVVADLRVRRHQILTAAEHLAGDRLAVRARADQHHGPLLSAALARLEKIETHLVWVLEQLDAAAGELEQAGR